MQSQLHERHNATPVRENVLMKFVPAAHLGIENSWHLHTPLERIRGTQLTLTALMN
jgi:hypothetical protein